MIGTRRERAHLVLADGTVFAGEAAGCTPESGITTGEVVFNTAMAGYQEIMTDPSYAGQIVTFTYPHIGNYGTSAIDEESGAVHASGMVVRSLTEFPSNYRSETSLEHYLYRSDISVICEVDTRRLTRHLRDHGAMPGAFGTAALDDLIEAARSARGTDGCDLVAEVTVDEPIDIPGDGFSIVVYDFGVKAAMVRQLAGLGTLRIVPASTPADVVLARRPDGVFLSNGPGDPAALGHISSQIAQLVGEVPIFGICLGHQLLAQALGAETFKLPFGHHGANHPVKDLSTGKVEITSQNHNYAVRDSSLTQGIVSHRNLNDGVVEGICYDDAAAFSVQYHPEAGPGPHDARYLFDTFATLMERAR